MTPILKTIARTRDIAKAATPGPWKWESSPDYLDPELSEEIQNFYPQSAWLVGVLEYEGCGSHGCKGKAENKDHITHNDPSRVLAMCDALEEAVRALDEMKGPTYGTESCNTDGENWGIVQGHLSNYHAKSRRTLKSIAERLGKE